MVLKFVRYVELVRDRIIYTIYMERLRVKHKYVYLNYTSTHKYERVIIILNFRMRYDFTKKKNVHIYRVVHKHYGNEKQKAKFGYDEIGQKRFVNVSIKIRLKT